ncbi:triphosphoribosyl-dephospho-CoA synthase [Gephyromycinifex aptenodytis]|uniref:triphosphoribosyl-dephospho-CoA synthase n=1 Tax=Gephyromycinifex aptenodytis TaxID=2716227 RepID=UPI001445A923|nr:triphosphoribosyl-dephospho-CoA synthase [Gephyromycinifex aptenodytis]
MSLRYEQDPQQVRIDVDEQGWRLGVLGYQALLVEARLTPKPGLVDRRNTGAHTDMDLGTFERAAAALQPWLVSLAQAGLEAGRAEAARGESLDEALFTARLRRLGLLAERSMLVATGGVNTHKGAIFALGLLLAAIGRRRGREGTHAATVGNVCDDVAALATPLLSELGTRRTGPVTAGERLFHSHALPGARGEAAGGFPRARHQALPAYRDALQEHGDEERALLHALLMLYASNADTNLAHRGGLAAVDYVRDRAARLLAVGGADRADHPRLLEEFDDDLIARRLSPGGCADLLSVTWVLARLPE